VDVSHRKIHEDFEVICDVGEVLEGVGTKFLMNPTLRDATHQYVLANISIMMPWM
jgi:hypothetical protein